MNGNMHTLMKKAVLAAALVAGASGVVRADDNSMNPFTGDSYAYFNSGYDRPAIVNPTFDNSLSAWRRVAPHLLVTEIPGQHMDTDDSGTGILGRRNVDTLAARVSATLT